MLEIPGPFIVLHVDQTIHWPVSLFPISRLPWSPGSDFPMAHLQTPRGRHLRSGTTTHFQETVPEAQCAVRPFSAQALSLLLLDFFVPLKLTSG